MATAKLPVWRTTKDCGAFIVDHWGDLVRIGWLPLILLFALNVGFGTYEPVTIDRENPLANIEFSTALIVLMLQGAIATVMLVAWHRLVMRDYVDAAPETAGGPGPGRRASIYFLQFLTLSIVFLFVFVAAMLLAATVLHGFHFFAFGSPGYAMKIGIGYVALLIGLLPAFYVASRLALALPATAVDRRERFERAWEASAGNGWRMVAVTVLAMLPIELVQFGVTVAARSLADTILFYPLVLLACVGVLMLMVALGTVLSKCYAAIMRPARRAAPEGALAPAAG